MECLLEQHCGSRTVYRTRILIREGKMIEGCFQCTDDLLTPSYSTVKRLVTCSNGHQYWISPAHKRDIQSRQLAPDMRSVWKDKKGYGSKVRLGPATSNGDVSRSGRYGVV